MEDRVKEFLASGKLEEYVLGILDPKDENNSSSRYCCLFDIGMALV